MSGEWELLWRLGLALLLSAAIGTEREMRQKSAGLRTYTLVGVGAALFVLWAMAAGAGLGVLATAGTLIYMFVAYAFPVITQRLPRSRGRAVLLRVTCLHGRGILRSAPASCTNAGFAVSDLATHHSEGDARAVAVQLEPRGNGSLAELATDLDGIDGVLAVSAEDDDTGDDRD